MSKITGQEKTQDVPQKVMLLYKAVAEMIAEGVDVNNISVAAITEKAGIGKGTAYEYFNSKEDILVCAIIYYVQNIYEQISTMLAPCEGFAQRIALLLEEMEHGGDKECCIVRYVHIMTDNSGIGRMVAQKMKEEPLCHYLPYAVLTDMLQHAVERGEVRADLPMDYMVFTLFSKLMTYFMYINAEGPVRMPCGQIRPYL